MQDLSTRSTKKLIREQIWKYLEEQNLARFPRPVYNRIPNFVGAEGAAARLRKIEAFRKAESVKANPDAPQLHVRRIVLEEGKTLLMPTPRLSAGFLKLDPGRIPRKMIARATSISGASSIGQRVALSDLPRVDLIVAGSVAVSTEGGRIGKGEGYGEIEYGILSECGLVSDRVKIITTIHDCQIVNPFPVESHDVPVDYVLTPTRLLETHTRLPRPRGIHWELVTPEMLAKMPILRELRLKSQLK